MRRGREAILRRWVVIRLRNERLELSTQHSWEDRAAVANERPHRIKTRSQQDMIVEDAEELLLELLRNIAAAVACRLHELVDVVRQRVGWPHRHHTRSK